MEDSISSTDNRRANDGIEVRQLEKDRYYIEKLRKQREKVCQDITQMELMQQQYRRQQISMKEQDNYITKLEEQLSGSSKKEDLQAMRQQVISCQNQLKKLREQHLRAKQEAAEIHEKLIDQESLNFDLNEKLAAQQEAINLLKSRLVNQQQKMSSLTTSHDQQIDAIRQKWVPFKSELEALRKKNKQLQSKIHTICQENLQLKKLSSDQQNQIQNLKSDNEILSRKVKQQPTHHRSHQDPSKQVVSVLEHELRRSDSKCEKMETEINQLKMICREKERRLSQMGMALKQQMAVISSLQDTIKDQQKLIENGKTTCMSQQETIQRLRVEMECVKQPSEASTQEPEFELLKIQLSRMRNHEIDLMDQIFEEFRVNRHF